jgi:hypothetical protein
MSQLRQAFAIAGVAYARQPHQGSALLACHPGNIRWPMLRCNFTVVNAHGRELHVMLGSARFERDGRHACMPAFPRIGAALVHKGQPPETATG